MIGRNEECGERLTVAWLVLGRLHVTTLPAR